MSFVRFVSFTSGPDLTLAVSRVPNMTQSSLGICANFTCGRLETEPDPLARDGPSWGARPFPKGDRSGRFVTLASGSTEDGDAGPCAQMRGYLAPR